MQLSNSLFRILQLGARSCVVAVSYARQSRIPVQHSMDTLAAGTRPRCSSVAPRTWPRQHSQSWRCTKREIRCQNASTAVDATAGKSVDSVPRSRPPRKAGSVHQDKVIIIGAGIAGLATAAACQKVWRAAACADCTCAIVFTTFWVLIAEQLTTWQGHTARPVQ